MADTKTQTADKNETPEQRDKRLLAAPFAGELPRGHLWDADGKKWRPKTTAEILKSGFDGVTVPDGHKWSDKRGWVPA